MSINSEDVKLYESQRLTDEDDGGGRATGIEVVDGSINNLFPDISRLDRTLGDVALRKAFVGVATDNSDTYLGAHAIIVEPPADPNVHVVMFDAGSESDERNDAQQRIESYVVRGSAAQWDLMGSQYEGQRQVVGVQREEQDIPEVGDVYMFENTATSDQQYVRITEVSSAIQTFTVSRGTGLVNFDRRRLDLGISAPLDFTFPGDDPQPEGPQAPHADIYSTEVADAARYWGTSNTTEAASIGDVQVKVGSIFANLVPSAQAESPIIDQPMGLQPKDIRPASETTYSPPATLEYITTSVVRCYLPRPAVRGTVVFSAGGSTYVDDGSGILSRSSGSFPFSTLTIDHVTGMILGTRDSGTASVGTEVVAAVSFMPGAVFSGKPVSISIPVVLANRGYNWIQTFPELKPRPGTVVVSYMAQGKWYDIKDPGNGVLEGVGSGTVNFTTGTIAVTLEALPDVDSALIWSYIADLADDTNIHEGLEANAGGVVEIQVDEGMKPGTVVVTYTAGAVTKTLNDSVAISILAGDGEGWINYGTGLITFTPTLMPDDATDITVDYDFAGSDEYIVASPSFTSGVVSGTIPNAPLEPGSVEFMGMVSYRNSYDVEITRLHSMIDDGLGGVLYGKGSSLAPSLGVGTINYATGAFSIELLHEWQKYQRKATYTSSYSGGVRSYSSAYTSGQTPERETFAGPLTVKYNSANPTVSVGQTVTPFDSVSLQILPGAGFKNLIPGSLLFTWGGETYIDRDGQIYQGFDSTNGSATSVGSINYSDRTISMNTWAEGAALGVNILAAATVNEPLSINTMSFRTPGKPLRPQSLSITITDVDGNLISEQVAIDGTISGASVEGTVNVETGVVDLEFTDGVDPVFVFGDTGRYNAVLYSFLPLDAELIGLNPVRLPSDGRVPWVREGDVIVVSHTTETDVGTPTDGQQDTLARDHQASILVVDVNGVALDPAQYIGNLLTGVVTFANPVTLEDINATALTGPFTVNDRVEHMSVVNDVQITGELSFIAPLGHDFPANETVISSALVWGDINSRVFKFFTQRTWSSGTPNWTDERIGDDTTSQYNDIDNPIEYANRGAITEKWAIVFTSTTTFNIVGEQLGIIGTGSTSIDLAPPNPNTGFPYFVMRAAGWGGGWANGNVVRFNTDGCLAPIWIARTVLSGQAQEADDQFVLQIRGDAD